MKSKLILLGCMLFSGIVIAQTRNSADISQLEMKNAAAMLSFKTNPNTQNYDVTYQKIACAVDPAQQYISGTVTTTLKALSDLNYVYFDLTQDLTVDSVTANNSSLVFSQIATDQLKITLASTLTAGQSITLQVTYKGIPPVNKEQAFITSSHSGTPVLWTLSEPYGALEWWPCKQDLNDKIDRIDFEITTPKEYVAVANGVENKSQVINGNYKTTYFSHQYPIPAYLVAIAVTNYSVYTQTAGTSPNTYPIVNYVYPESLNNVKTQLNNTPILLDLFSNLFENYPYASEKYGHAQFGWGGGMEHTTVSFMVNFSRDLIAHEMAHQWFGDKITCGTWKDIWLNEGFATYVAALAIENLDGANAFNLEKKNMVADITSLSTGSVYLSDADLTDVNRIFSSRLSYNKGAMVLHMLRKKLGDTNFFTAIKNYLKDPKLAYGYATTADLKAHLEAVYGSSLTDFFNDWIYGQGYPKYQIGVNNLGGGKTKFTIQQTPISTNVPFFELPITIKVKGALGQEKDVTLNNTSNGETFEENVGFDVTQVIFDPYSDIISKSNTVTLANNSFEIEKIKIVVNKGYLDILAPSGFVFSNVEILDLQGRIVLRSSNLTQIDLGGLSKGIYVVKINGDKVIKSEKIQLQ